MASSFHPIFEDFLKIADPIRKYKSDWSCLGFYNTLEEAFCKLEAEILIYYTSVNFADRHLFINAYLKQIINVSNNFIAGPSDWAEHYLKTNETTLEKIFENDIYFFKKPHDEFPIYLKYSYLDLNERHAGYKVFDLHTAFFFYISEFYIAKLQNFFSNLPGAGIVKESVEKKSITEKTKSTRTFAFTLKSYNSKLSNITNLHDSLIKNSFINKGTDLKDFRKIFNNTNPSNPIQWTGNLSELRYFILLIHKEHKLIIKITRDIWKVTAKLFVDSKGNSFDWRKFRGQKKPASASLIETAVNNLL